MVILNVLAPAEVGGLESVVESLAQGLLERSHDVHVAALVGRSGARHPYVRRLSDAGIPVHEVATEHRAYLRQRALVGDLSRRIGAEVVHTHGYQADLVAGSAARRVGMPRATTVHGFTGGDLRNRLYEILQCRAFRSFDAVVAVSRPLTDRLSRAGVPASRLRLIPNAWAGASSLASRSEARRELGLGDDCFQIGWIGRLSHEKGADVMVDAARLLGDLQVQFNVIGDGPELPRLRERAAGSAGSARVHWLGTRAGAARLFPAFDAFLLSSRTEGTPIVLFEAMAAGVPIIATRVGGVPDVVDAATGILVPPGDPSAIASAVRTVITDRAAAATRACAARNRLDTRHGREEWLRLYESLYHDLARSPSGND